MITRLTFVMLLVAGPVVAQDRAVTLLGRSVVFNVATWDDPAAPYLVSRDYRAKAGDGPEFGMVAEGQSGLDVVPVLVDIGADRIDLSYPGQMPGEFTPAAFNGYVMTFSSECTLITAARIDPAATTLPLTDNDLIVAPQSLSVNVQGHAFDKHTTIGILVGVADCPIS